MGVTCMALASFRPVSGVRSYVRGPRRRRPPVFPARLLKIETGPVTGHWRTLEV